MYGWHGVLLNIDLSKEKIERENIPEKELHEWIGGEAMGANWLYNEVPAGLDAFDPRQLFIIAPGPGTGTLMPGSARFEVIARSAITNKFGDSNCGGPFGAELRLAGYDAIKIRGKAEKPVYLLIQDDHVELRDASHLWGLPHIEAMEKVKQELHDPLVKTFAIGPGAEKLVRYACAYSGKRAVAGFNGAGTMMGAKNLKMIVVRGTKGIPIYDPKGLEDLTMEIMDRIMGGPFYWVFAEEGARGVIQSALMRMGVFDGRNCQDLYLTKDQWEKVGYPAYSKNKVKNWACFGCFVHCKHVMNVKSGTYAGTRIKATEFYPTVTLGTNLGIYNCEFNIKAVEEVDKYGLDVGYTGSIMGWVAELFQRGIVTKQDIGLDLTWGNEPAFMDLIGMIGRREGFGDILADGFLPAMEKIGKNCDRYAVQSKGFPMIAAGIGYVATTSMSWVTAMNSNFVKGSTTVEWGEGMIPGLNEKRAKEYFGIPSLHPEVYEGKEKVVKWAEDTRVLSDSVPCCAFMGNVFGQGLKRGINVKDLARFLKVITGVDYTEEKLMKLAERSISLQMAYNAREGLRRGDFVLPKRYTHDKRKGGPHADYKFPLADYTAAMDRYFKLRGCNEEAIPTRETLEGFGYKYVADDLEKMGILKKKPKGKSKS